MPHITQIAATEQESETTFNTYVIPKLPITTKAQELTGIVLSNSNNMTVYDESVEANKIF